MYNLLLLHKPNYPLSVLTPLKRAPQKPGIPDEYAGCQIGTYNKEYGYTDMT